MPCCLVFIINLLEYMVSVKNGRACPELNHTNNNKNSRKIKEIPSQ